MSVCNQTDTLVVDLLTVGKRNRIQLGNVGNFDVIYLGYIRQAEPQSC